MNFQSLRCQQEEGNDLLHCTIYDCPHLYADYFFSKKTVYVSKYKQTLTNTEHEPPEIFMDYCIYFTVMVRETDASIRRDMRLSSKFLLI